MDRRPGDELESGRRLAAMWAALWTALLYATIPLVRTLQRWMASHELERWITPSVIAALLALVAVAAIHLVRSETRPGWVDGVWLGAVAAVAGGWAWRLRDRPEEAVHLVQYGVLCWLIYRALRPQRPDAAVLMSAILLGTVMGTVDEIIQWITPARFWDLRDVALNGGACVLGAVVAWRLEPGPWRPPPRESVGRALRFGALLVALITLCLANTPVRVAWYSARVPGLGFLAHPSNEMAGYGHLHRLEGVGVFKSRLTREELAEQDRRRGAGVAAIINRYPDSEYERFHRDHQGFADPLTYEARVHVFSRDRNLRRARESQRGSEEWRRQTTSAYREHQILETAFPNTLAHSVHGLDRVTVDTLREDHDPSWPFASAAGSHLITWISEGALRVGLLMVVLVLVGLDLIVERSREKRR